MNLRMQSLLFSHAAHEPFTHKAIYIEDARREMYGLVVDSILAGCALAPLATQAELVARGLAIVQAQIRPADWDVSEEPSNVLRGKCSAAHVRAAAPAAAPAICRSR